MKLLPDEHAVSGIKKTPGPVTKAVHQSQDGPVFLILDEWDKTRPSADSFLLDFLQSGRITFDNGGHIAKMENLSVWITMNDERDLSEPLMRRLPLIQFTSLSTSLVANALELTHPQHPYLNAALRLYMACLATENLSKPCTIQELRQLLDAATHLGDEANWDDLVFQYVTKTNDNHTLVAQTVANGDFKAAEEIDRGRLKPESFNDEVEIENKHNGHSPAMPSAMSKERGYKWFFEGKQNPDFSKAFGAIKKTDYSYDKLVHLAKRPRKDPADLGIAEVFDKDDEQVLFLTKPIPALNHEAIYSLFDSNLEGELVVTEPDFKLAHVHVLQERGAKVVKFSEDEILFREKNIEARWTPDKGLEAILPASDRNAYAQYFWNGEIGQSKWYIIKGKTQSQYRNRGFSKGQKKTDSICISKSDDVWAHIVVEKEKALTKQHGPYVVARCVIYLTSDETGNNLHPSIVFGDRIKIEAQNANQTWTLAASTGMTSSIEPYKGKYRAFREIIQERDWKSATHKAALWGHMQVLKVLHAKREDRAVMEGIS
jgi:hypothetical protein